MKFYFHQYLRSPKESGPLAPIQFGAMGWLQKPHRSETLQPRATPWVRFSEWIKPCKGDTTPHGGHRPTGLGVEDVPTLGVALGCDVPPLWGLKPTIATLWVLGCGLLSAQEPFTFETATDLYSAADLNADSRRDMVLVDKATGTLTLGFQEATGAFTFGTPVPSGVEDPSGLAVGKFTGTTSDNFIVTGPTAGRLQLFSATAPNTVLTSTPLYANFPTAFSVAALDIDGIAPVDVLVTGDRGATLSGRYPYTGLSALSTTPTVTFSMNYAATTMQLNPARPKSSIAPWLLSQYGGSTWYLEPISASGVGSGLNFGSGGRMATGFFDATTLASFLLYTPGGAGLTHRKIIDTAGVYSLAAAQNFTLPKAIALVVPVTSATIKMLAVLHSDGTAATYDFNGSTAPVLRQNLPSTGLARLLPLENGGVLALTGGATPSWTRYNFNGTSHTAAFTGALPLAAPLAASLSNIICFNGEPLVNPSAAPTGQLNWREWTASPVVLNSSGQVAGSVLGTPSVGLTNLISTAFTVPPLTTHLLVNQYRADASVFSLSSRVGRESGDVTFSPPGGTYPETPPLTTPSDGHGLSVRIAPTLSGDSVYYRLSSASAWTVLGSSGLITLPPRVSGTLTTTIDAYSQGSANRRSAIRTATYIRVAEPALPLGSSSVDANNNGLADAWEKNFAISDPNVDTDGDGATNLAEFQAGTDPRSALSIPPPPLILTGAKTTNVSGTPVLRLEWPTTQATVVLESSPTLQGPWTTITIGISIVGANYRYDVNVATPVIAKNFYRLKQP